MRSVLPQRRRERSEGSLRDVVSQIVGDVAQLLAGCTFSRRHLLGAAGSFAFASRLAAATNEDREKLTIIPKRMEKVFNEHSLRQDS